MAVAGDEILVAITNPDAQPSPAGAQPSAIAAHIGRYRWTICGLIFLITTLNYMDRQVLALLLPVLQDPVKGIGLTQVQYGAIVSIFSSAYAVGLLLAGNNIDRIGTKKGYAAAVILWSFAAMSHFFVTVPAVTTGIASVARLVSHGFALVPMLGSANWVKNIGMLSGSVIGSLAIMRFLLWTRRGRQLSCCHQDHSQNGFRRKNAPLPRGSLTPAPTLGPPSCRLSLGSWWYGSVGATAFLTTGLLSITWLIIWPQDLFNSAGENPHVTREELAYINSDPSEQASKIAWARLIPHRQTWAFLCGKLLTDPIWWFYLFWLPGYLFTRYGLSIAKMGLPLLIIYNVCTVGSIFGGWLPTKFVSMGWSQNRARKTAMLIYACGIAPIMLIGYAPNIWVAIAMISLATSLQIRRGRANLFTLLSDMFPRRAVASVVGIGVASGGLVLQ